MADNDYKYLVRAILIGDLSTGKSCVLERLKDPMLAFNPEMKSTTGLDFKLVKRTIGGEIYKIQIWDMGGHEMYSKIRPSYYTNINVAILVCDISKRATFTHLEKWLQEARENTKNNIEFILVANKSDIDPSLREVHPEELETFAFENKLLGFNGNVGYFEVSAKDNTNIEPILDAIGASYLRQRAATEKALAPILVSASDSRQEEVAPNLFSSVSEARTAIDDYLKTRTGYFNKGIYAFSELFRYIQDKPSMEKLKRDACNDLYAALEGHIAFATIKANHPEALADESDRLTKLFHRIVLSNLAITPRETPTAESARYL